MADGVERSGGSWGRATTSERKKTWRRKELHGNEERERGRKRGGGVGLIGREMGVMNVDVSHAALTTANTRTG